MLGITGRLASGLALCLATSGCYTGLEPGDGFLSGTGGELDDGGLGDDTGNVVTGGVPNPESSTSGSQPGGDATSGADGGGFETGGFDDGGAPEDDDDGAEAKELAPGVSISSVEMNQGVSISIIRNGEIVSPGARNASIIPGRPALVRGLWTVDDDFVPRELEGRFIVTRPGGQTQTFVDVRNVTGDADASRVDGGFVWELPEGVLDSGASFAVEIGEVEGAPPAPGALGRARVPADGEAALQAASGDHLLEVVIVPIRYTHNGQNRTPDLSAANRKLIEDEIFDANPVEDITVRFHAPVTYPDRVETSDELGETLGFLSSLRNSEGAPSHVYYAGLIDVGCFVVGCGGAGTAGIAYVASPGGSGGLERVSSSVWFDPEDSVRALVHEIGHNQGLRHVECPGGLQSAGNDPSYPHADGRIGVWGYGLRSGAVVGSDTFDYMSYCGPVWASDFTWEKTRTRIATLSANASSNIAPSGSGRLLAGIIYDSGKTTWFELSGTLDAQVPRSNRQLVEFSRDTLGVQRRPVATGEIADLDAHWVLVEMPENVRRASWIDGPVQREIDLSNLDRFDRMRAATK